jgi:hypothetical protein
VALGREWGAGDKDDELGFDESAKLGGDFGVEVGHRVFSGERERGAVDAFWPDQTMIEGEY